MTYEEKRRQIQLRLADYSNLEFDELALDIFRYQAEYNELYTSYLKLIDKKVSLIKHANQIPFLPIQLFRNYRIKTGQWQEQFIFGSGGTTGQTTSRHFVRDLDWYQQNCRTAFVQQYGPLKDYTILALLPSYLERSGSSLISMVAHFIEVSGQKDGGFFLDNTSELLSVLESIWSNPNSRALLLGVSFALLDLAESSKVDLKKCIIMETGGMKGRRKEITREELHQVLKTSFGVPFIHSEYGMTELFSQAYSHGNGRFVPAPTLKAVAREITDPFTLVPYGKLGALNFIDLANFDTCSFIATDDLGKVYEDGTFEVLGRLDNSDIRGCNLMVRDGISGG